MKLILKEDVCFSTLRLTKFIQDMTGKEGWMTPEMMGEDGWETPLNNDEEEGGCRAL